MSHHVSWDHSFLFMGVLDLVPLYTSFSAAILNLSSSSSSSSSAAVLVRFPLLLEILFRSFFTAPAVVMECRSAFGVLLSRTVAVDAVDFLLLVLLLVLALPLELSLLSTITTAAVLVCFLGGLGLGLGLAAGRLELVERRRDCEEAVDDSDVDLRRPLSSSSSSCEGVIDELPVNNTTTLHPSCHNSLTHLCMVSGYNP